MTEPAYVTIRWMAAYWGVSERTVERDIRKGALRVYRLPSQDGGRRAVRILKSDALAYGRPSE